MGAQLVRWIYGTARDLPDDAAHLALMTGNVAQVFLTDHDWHETLRDIRRALREGGHLVFETRDPHQRAWETWTHDATLRSIPLADGTTVTTWTDVVGVDLPFVTFVHHYQFTPEERPVTSTSTLRFRTLSDLTNELPACGFRVTDIRGAPDRPGLEHVVIAQR